jgi:hypothetical protein
VVTNANLTGVVTSVGNQTSVASGAITSDMIGTLTKSKVGLDLVNNTSDAAKPISTLTQSALDLKANTSSLSTVATSGSYNDLINKPAVPAAYSLPTASASALGGIKIGNNLSIDGNGVLSGASSYNLPTASSSALGGIKVGNNLSIDGNGVLSGASSYNLPTASASQSGGVKVGTGLTITGGVLSASAAGVPYTGATQAVDLGAFDLKVNGITVGLGKNGIDNNVAIGQSALSNTTSGFQGNYLTAVGYEALKTNTWGYFNTAIGSSSLFSNTTGLANTSIGSNSLLNNTTANFNTAVGTSALRNNTTGENNTASGASSLVNNTTGEQNSAFGRNALESNTTGSINTATGVGALSSNTAGGANTANGASALTSNIAGGGNTAMGNNALRNTNSSENTAIGNNAGVLNTTGTNNTAIGGYANFGANNLTNATALGYEATVSASNTIQLGNTSVTNVKTSGTLTTGTVTYPSEHGTNGQVLTTTGSGTLTWTSAPTYSVGLNPALGGYVFYVTPDGKHGLVAETIDQLGASDFPLESIYRASQGKAIDNITNPAKHSADGANFADWRLPTRFEMLLMYNTIGPGASGSNVNIGNFNNTKLYLTATPRDDYTQIGINFSNGASDRYYLYIASSLEAVRAVRSL